MYPTRCRPLIRNQKPQELGNPVGVSAVTILGKESEAQGTRDLTLNRPTGTGGPSWVLSLSFPVKKSSSPFLLLAMRGIGGGAGVQGSWGQGRGKGWGTGSEPSSLRKPRTPSDDSAPRCASAFEASPSRRPRGWGLSTRFRTHGNWGSERGCDWPQGTPPSGGAGTRALRVQGATPGWGPLARTTAPGFWSLPRA